MSCLSQYSCKISFSVSPHLQFPSCPESHASFPKQRNPCACHSVSHANALTARVRTVSRILSQASMTGVADVGDCGAEPLRIVSGEDALNIRLVVFVGATRASWMC